MSNLAVLLMECPSASASSPPAAEAAALLSAALRLRPLDPALLCNRARVAMEAAASPSSAGEDDALAESYCAAALLADPACAQAAFLGAEVARDRGRAAAAAALYRKVRRARVRNQRATERSRNAK
jgi:hypothetical protein